MPSFFLSHTGTVATRSTSEHVPLAFRKGLLESCYASAERCTVGPTYVLQGIYTPTGAGTCTKNTATCVPGAANSFVTCMAEVGVRGGAGLSPEEKRKAKTKAMGLIAHSQELFQVGRQ